MAAQEYPAPESVSRLLPVLQIPQADAAIEVRGPMVGFRLRKLRVRPRGGFVIAHLILYVPQRGVQTRIPFAVFDRLGEEACGAFELALKV